MAHDGSERIQKLAKQVLKFPAAAASVTARWLLDNMTELVGGDLHFRTTATISGGAGTPEHFNGDATQAAPDTITPSSNTKQIVITVPASLNAGMRHLEVSFDGGTKWFNEIPKGGIAVFDLNVTSFKVRGDSGTTTFYSIVAMV